MLGSLLACTLTLAQPSVPPSPPAQPPIATQPGVTFRLYQLEGDAIKAIPTLKEGQTPNVDELRPVIDWKTPDFPKVAAPFLTHVITTLTPPRTGYYTFRLTSDDGSRLTLDGALIIDHDGRHGVTARQSAPQALRAGEARRLRIEHFDSGGGRALKLEWRAAADEPFTVVPPEAFSTEIDNARVTSPGVKALADARRPGDGSPVTGVHSSFTLETIKVEGFDPMVGAMAVTPDGRLIVGTFNPLQRDDVKLPDIESKPADKLYALSGALGDVHKVTVKVCADGLYEPCGLCAVGDALYVSHRRAITRLLDKDGDGFYETHEDVAKGWAAWNYHQFTFGLVHRPDTENVPAGPGWLYATLSTAMAPPKWEGMGTNAAPNDPLRGTAIEVDLSSNTFRVIAAGLRAPNGIGWGPRGVDGQQSLFYTDNQGAWLPSNHMGEIVDGRFFGHFNNSNLVPNLADRFPTGGIASTWPDRLRARPALDLVYGDIANSPTQPVLIEHGPYRNQLLIGELTGGGIRRGCMEQVNGQWQGAVFQFSQGFSVGINRVAWAPGGVLFAGGIGA
ncbi:MAG TPA: PA14 domain-containing protein, partial [Phycisphaerales bacterium]|nr:PA14 domain-containing protein [Phycisphaerales bacterium]